MRGSVPLLGGLAVLLLAGCSKPPDAINIGVNTELTGSIPIVGQSCRNAAEMAVDEINASGGVTVDGRKLPIRITVADNEDKAEAAAAVAQKFISENMLAMIGPNASRNAIPAAEVSEAGRLPMISPWSTNARLTIDSRSGKPKRFVFRTAFIDDFQGVVAARFARERLKTAKPAVLYDVASEANKGIAEVYRDAMTKAGVAPIAFESYTTGDKDFSAQLTRIIHAGADSLYLPNYYSEAPMQMKQARKLGFKGVFFGNDAWGNIELVKLAGPACEGAFFFSHYAPDIATPRARTFIEAYKRRYKQEPDDVAALTYDSFGLLCEAITKAGALDRAKLRDALASIEHYEGVTGEMQFKGTGDPVKSAVVIQIRGGRFVYHAAAKP